MHSISGVIVIFHDAAFQRPPVKILHEMPSVLRTFTDMLPMGRTIQYHFFNNQNSRKHLKAALEGCITPFSYARDTSQACLFKDRPILLDERGFESSGMAITLKSDLSSSRYAMVCRSLREA